jgi:hypothetical protein
MFDSLTPDQKSVYGNDIENMKKDFISSTNLANKAFDRATKMASEIKDANGD